MDELRAYKVLGLQPGSSEKEIKEAYAALSKQFHPEEYPEEFQQIHEAYTTLVRGSRRRGRRTESVQSTERQEHIQQETFRADQRRKEADAENEPDKERSQEEQKQREMARKYRSVVQRAENTRDEEQTETAYDFENAVNRAEQEKAEQLRQLTIQALNEFQILLQPGYKEKLKLFKAFFTKENYAEVLKTAQFVEGLAELLEDGKLKKGIYDYIIDFYRLRGYTEGQLIPEAAVLYRVLEQKRGMEAKKKENLAYAIPAGVSGGLWAGLRGAARSSKVMGVLMLCVLAIVLLIWIYRKLYENHSSIFSQAVIAAGIVISQFFVIMTDFYGTAFGSIDNGIVVATLLFFAALIWLGILLAAAVILKVIHRIRKK